LTARDKTKQASSFLSLSFVSSTILQGAGHGRRALLTLAILNCFGQSNRIRGRGATRQARRFFRQLLLALHKSRARITVQFARVHHPVGLKEAIMLSRFRRHKPFARQIHFYRTRRSAFLRVEELESRFLFSAGGLDGIFAAPDRGHDGIFAPDRGHGGVTFPDPVGYTPGQIRHAYGFDQINGDGTGQTIAIVDAYDDPNIFKDLDVFDSTFGIPGGAASNFLTKATPQGKPRTSANWAGEISLDVEWAHAIAPGAHILLVETGSNSLSDLLGGVSYANSQPGVVAVSMSWGGGEFSSEVLYDSYFTTAGITYTAAAGDSPGEIWPSTSSNVLSVGGTTLAGLNKASDYSSATETGWSSNGGGTSAYEPLPSYQSGVTNTSTRANPDVAFDADPNTGVAIYDTVAYFGQTGWFQAGGTSLGAPAWAGLVAIADQGRGAGHSLSSTQTLATLYANPSDFHYIASSAANTTAPGFNLATGLGTPIANRVVQSLVAAKAAPAQTSGTTSTAGQTLASNGNRSATAKDITTSTPVVTFFLFLGTQPQISYGPATPTSPGSLVLPAASGAVFVPPSFSAVGATSGLTGSLSSASDYARGGLGPVLPGPEDQQPAVSPAGQTGSRVKPDKVPTNSPEPAPDSPQKNQLPPAPESKNENGAPGDGFWEEIGPVDAAFVIRDDPFTDSAESAAFLPGLVALMAGSWGASLIDSKLQSETPDPKSKKNRADF
jgi:hypothetical protein